jgi:hypothetical protein
VHKRTDLVGWLESWRKDVEDQAERVLQRLNQARQELADRAAIPISTAAEWRQLNQLKEQVSMLQWRHGELGPRQQDAARVLQEERTLLAAAQDRLSAMGPAPAPPPPSPPSTPVSEASFATASAFTSYHTPEYNPEGSIASDVASADLRQQRVAQLQRQASELGRRAQALEERLKAVTEESTELAPEVKKAEAQYKASEDRIAWALAEGDAGRRAGFETAQVRLYLHMDGLRQQAEGLGRSRDALAAQLDAVRGELNEARRQLAEAGVSARHSSSSSSVWSETDVNLLEAALPHGGAAVARLAERAARRSPRTAGEQLRTFFQGRPKPLEGKRLESFMQLVHADVMTVARQANLPPQNAADLMRSAVTRGALGTALAQEDRSELLAALNRVQEHLAAQEEP